MADKSYSNRELDQFFKAADTRADELHNTLMQRMDVFESNTSVALQSIESKVSYTNGKVKKLIIAGFLIGGILIGQTFANMHDIITLMSTLI